MAVVYIVIRLMSLELTNDKSTLVQVMAWWQQAIAWANVEPDLYRRMASLGYNGLNQVILH